VNCVQLEVVKLLVESGANVNHRDNLGVTALFLAAGDLRICARFATNLTFVINLSSFGLPLH